MRAPLILHYAPDNASLCVRLALEELGLPHETRLVDRRAQGQKTPRYLALNPNGLIPVLETPEGPLYETGAILLWLADRHPGRAFPAPDAEGRGPALTRLIWLANTLHPALRMLFYPEQYQPADPGMLRRATQLRLTGLLDLLAARMSACLVTDRPDVVACYLAPMLRWCALYGGDTTWFDLGRWPGLLAFARAFEARAAAMRAAAAEGLGPTPFSAPILPTPPEGSAT